jgi:LacI family transcriptional regulator
VTRARQGLGRIDVVAPFTSLPSFARRLIGILHVALGEGLEVVVDDEESAAKSRLISLPVRSASTG